MRATENVSTTSAARDVADEQALIESLFDPAKSAGGGKLLWPRRYAAKGGKFTPDKRLFALATTMGVTGITRAWQGNASWERLDGAWYNPAVDAVQMPDASRFEEESEFNMVFLHELTHATQRRVGRDKRNYAEEELVAELGANLIARRIGLHPKALRQSAYYLQVWLTRCGSQSASRAFAEREARRAADYIMEKWRLVNTTK